MIILNIVVLKHIVVQLCKNFRVFMNQVLKLENLMLDFKRCAVFPPISQDNKSYECNLFRERYDNKMMLAQILFSLVPILQLALSSPEVGKWDFNNLTSEYNYVGMVKNSYQGSKLDIRVGCNTQAGPFNVTIGYMLRRTKCWEEYLNLDNEEGMYQNYYTQPE